MIHSPAAVIRVRHHRHTERIYVRTEVQLALGPGRRQTGRTAHVVLEAARTLALQRLPIEADVVFAARLGVRLAVHAHLRADLCEVQVVGRGAGASAGQQAQENNCERLVRGHQ